MAAIDGGGGGVDGPVGSGVCTVADVGQAVVPKTMATPITIRTITLRT